jgi:hypothetical protein
LYLYCLACTFVPVYSSSSSIYTQVEEDRHNLVSPAVHLTLYLYCDTTTLPGTMVLWRYTHHTLTIPSPNPDIPLLDLIPSRA